MQPFRGRFRTLLGAGRRDFTRHFQDSRDLDERRVAKRFKGQERWAANVRAELEQRGAPPTCFVVSADSDLDGRELELGEALKTLEDEWPGGSGTFLICLPGRLVYYVGELLDDRCILERQDEADS